jgi:quercetin dioxygenase-like cupin family protein
MHASYAQGQVIRVTDVPVETFDWGQLQWLVAGRTIPGCQQTLGVSTIGPGQQNPLHYHPNCEEVLYVISGYCEHRFDERWELMHPGDTAVIPAGMRHQLVNRGPDDVVCLIAFSSPDRQTVFLE